MLLNKNKNFEYYSKVLNSFKLISYPFNSIQ